MFLNHLERIRRIGIVECSEECVQTFLNRIKNILTVQIHQIKEQPPKKEIEGEEIMSFLNNFVQLCKQNEFTNLKEIAEVGESWIGIYSGVYDTIYDIYANLPTKDALESMDRELATAFFDYESCIHWEAGLKTGYDEPLYDWLEKNALPPTKNKLARVLMQNPDELQSPPPESHPVDMVQILTDELGPGMVVANPAQPNNNDGQHESSHINYEGVPQFFQ
ncbi:uncharacterized protein LOC135836928 [Planococcus citri]|uniref:uncharacterized protein LOC135836928 n=1 Tax=Planococcus citri TaxID=170843 RepID=UPI0031F99258